MKIINKLDYITPNLYTEAYVNELKEEITTKDKELLQLRQRIDKALEILKQCNVNMDSLWLCENIDHAIYTLKGEYNNV